jgi:hypothetical protein
MSIEEQIQDLLKGLNAEIAKNLLDKVKRNIDSFCIIDFSKEVIHSDGNLNVVWKG